MKKEVIVIFSKNPTHWLGWWSY